MRGNTFGKLFSITTFGESHGDALGVVIDGMPSNIEINTADLQAFVDRRRPGRLKVSTNRSEADKVEILSGVFENKTLGTPISVIVKNQNQKSSDYDKLKNEYRPGHADKTTLEKFGVRDHRGGGRASGRETVARVIAGYFAKLVLQQVKAQSYITQIANHTFKENSPENSKIGLADSSQDEAIEKFLLECKEKGESCGGSIKCTLSNIPKGLGEPVFDKLKADISKAVMSIGSCMGITFGLGVDFASKLGSEISQNSKNFAGIEGGISNGEDIYFTCYFKAPSTIGEKAKEGRHDPCILPRVLPVVESMAMITLVDHYLRQKAYQ